MNKHLTPPPVFMLVCTCVGVPRCIYMEPMECKGHVLFSSQQRKEPVTFSEKSAFIDKIQGRDLEHSTFMLSYECMSSFRLELNFNVTISSLTHLYDVCQSQRLSNQNEIHRLCVPHASLRMALIKALRIETK